MFTYEYGPGGKIGVAYMYFSVYINFFHAFLDKLGGENRGETTFGVYIHSIEKSPGFKNPSQMGFYVFFFFGGGQGYIFSKILW